MENKTEPQQRRLNNLKSTILKGGFFWGGARLHIELSRKDSKNKKPQRIRFESKKGFLQSRKYEGKKKCIH